MAEIVTLPRMLHHPDGRRLVVRTGEDLRAAEADGWQAHRGPAAEIADAPPVVSPDPIAPPARGKKTRR